MTPVPETTRRPAGAQPRVVDQGREDLLDRWLVHRVPGRLAASLLGAWLVLGGAIHLLEPAPAPGAVLPWYGEVLAVLLLWSATAALVGLVARRRLGVGASLVAALTLSASVVACPVSGHHAFGVWWLGQVAAVGALVVLSAAAVVATRRTA